VLDFPLRPAPIPVYAAAMDQSLPATEITALLGRGTRFEGKLHFEGRVRLDGIFKGEIKSDDTLIIGDGAEVHAEIDCSTVIVRGGTVHGNIRAKQMLELHAPAKLIGNIHSPSIFIDRGVEFQGSCRMDAIDGAAATTAPAVRPEPPVNGPRANADAKGNAAKEQARA
jgi:cytoskeletal protein CcmA (bactofilin family)